ncbi:hypothetical protein [Fervidibacter sp.]
MRELNFERHNEEARQVWQAYREGKPIRVPVIFGFNVRFTMWLPEANPRKITFEQYFSDPQIMLERKIEHIHWVRHNIPQDAEWVCRKMVGMSGSISKMSMRLLGSVAKFASTQTKSPMSSRC